MNCGEPQDHLPLACGVCVRFFKAPSVTVCACSFHSHTPVWEWEGGLKQYEMRQWQNGGPDGESEERSGRQISLKRNTMQKAAQESWNREIGWREETDRKVCMCVCVCGVLSASCMEDPVPAAVWYLRVFHSLGAISTVFLLKQNVSTSSVSDCGKKLAALKTSFPIHRFLLYTPFSIIV